MVLWLATYYKFYDEKVMKFVLKHLYICMLSLCISIIQIVSPSLCNVIGGPEMAKYLHEGSYIRLLRCFLHPDLILPHEESPSSLTEQQVLDLGVHGITQDIKCEGKHVDPLHQLFFADNESEKIGDAVNVLTPNIHDYLCFL